MKHLVSKTSNSSLSKFTDVQIQPNAIDLRIDKVFKINPRTVFSISEEGKSHRETTPVEPTMYAEKYFEEEWFELDAGQYEIIMEGIIDIAEGEAGWVITRSSLNRNGVFITSGLYDSGYTGVMAGCLHVPGKTRIRRGTRVGQFLLFDAENLTMYDGSYGVGKEHDEKYN